MPQGRLIFREGRMPGRSDNGRGLPDRSRSRVSDDFPLPVSEISEYFKSAPENEANLLRRFPQSGT